MYLQPQGYFGMKVIGNVNQFIPDPLQASSLQNLAGCDAQEIVNFHYRFCLDVIDKSIEG